VRDRAADEIDDEFITQRDDIVDVHGLARDMLAGRIMGNGFSENPHGTFG
jgi:hypothetical protein